MAHESEPETRPASATLGLLYLSGGVSFVLIGLMLGFGDMFAWSLSLALLVVGVTGIGAGSVIVWRALRERQKIPK